MPESERTLTATPIRRRRTRLRIPELLEERGWTVYRLHKATGGRVSMNYAYKLARDHGRFTRITPKQLAGLLDAFGVTLEQLIEVTPAKKRR
jgi:hypothetical protein